MTRKTQKHKRRALKQRGGAPSSSKTELLETQLARKHITCGKELNALEQALMNEYATLYMREGETESSAYEKAREHVESLRQEYTPEKLVEKYGTMRASKKTGLLEEKVNAPGRFSIFKKKLSTLRGNRNSNYNKAVRYLTQAERLPDTENGKRQRAKIHKVVEGLLTETNKHFMGKMNADEKKHVRQALNLAKGMPLRMNGPLGRKGTAKANAPTTSVVPTNAPTTLVAPVENKNLAAAKATNAPPPPPAENKNLAAAKATNAPPPPPA